MRTRIPAAAAFAAIVLAAALTGGCENDLDPIAPKDGVITLTANPSTVVLDQNIPFAHRDPESGQLDGTANIQATLFDKDGRPLQGTVVYFTTSGGRLRSAAAPGAPPNGVLTDVNGIAVDVLTVKESNGTIEPVTTTNPAAPPVTVTANSSIVTKTVDVKVTVRACANAAPVTNAGPDQTQVGGVLATTIVLDGRATTDAETANFQLLFLWSCGNGTSPFPVPDDLELEALFPQVVACDYESGANYVASLTVTDLGNGILDPDTGDYLCRKTATDTATITIED